MDKQWEAVRDFHKKFGHPAADTPIFMPRVRAQARYDWMAEEIEEFIEAGDVVDQADAMIDLIYFALGTLVEMGVKPDAIFEVVHRANMTKLWADGKPRYKPDGKTQKPPGWEDPYPKIKAIIEKEMGRPQ